MKPLGNLRGTPRRLPRSSVSSSSPLSSPSSSSISSSSSSAQSSATPRSRSNSASRSLYTAAAAQNTSPLSFFDSPAPPNAQRPARLPIKESSNQSQNTGNNGSQSHPSFQLGLSGTTLHANDTLLQHSNSSLFGYPQVNNGVNNPNNANTIPYYSYTAPANNAQNQVQESPLGLRLDVGAYGIPKNGRRENLYALDDDAGLSVQVGEDAYFLREDSLGVADGVGGWAKKAGSCAARGPTPSALFARRLMHFCSAELATSSSIPRAPHLNNGTKPPPQVPTIHPPRFLPLFPHTPLAFPMHVRSVTPPPAAVPSLPSINFDEIDEEYSELEALEDSLEELSDGIDVLKMLERAWESTCGAHVTRSGLGSRSQQEEIPLLSGSSTALVAVLGAAALAEGLEEENDSEKVLQLELEGKEVRLDVASAGIVWPAISAQSTPAKMTPEVHVDLNSTIPTANADTPAKAQTPMPAVLRIAHIGDSMGMLVRGESIAWRSEELWYRFNTPHQLSTTSPPPSAPGLARTYTVPVEADDILILASDGLSDNLWDEEVLEVVVGGRKCAGLNSTPETKMPVTDPTGILRRSTLAGILSESLCSRARRASEFGPKPTMRSCKAEVPFARRAREAGKVFNAPGKVDDISVIVAVISPTSFGAEHSAG